jgi:hypothetical protein
VDEDDGLVVRARQLETAEITAGAAAMGLEPADLLSECEFAIDEDWTITLRNWEELSAQLRSATGRMYAHRVANGLLTQEKADADVGATRLVPPRQHPMPIRPSDSAAYHLKPTGEPDALNPLVRWALFDRDTARAVLRHSAHEVLKPWRTRRDLAHEVGQIDQLGAGE